MDKALTYNAEGDVLPPANRMLSAGIRTLLLWVGGLGLALGLLIGRYDWSAAVARFAWRGYVSSAFMVAVTAPVLFYLLRLVFPRRPAWGVGITGAVTLWFCLPYRWLGLERWYYYRDAPSLYRATDPRFPAPAFDWLPQALDHLHAMPHETLFFGVLLGIGVLWAGGYAWWARRRSAVEASAGMSRRAGFWLLVYGLILLQTWLHLSLRAPNNYISPLVYQGHATIPDNYWAIGYMFPDGSGAVQGDYWPVWEDLQAHFQGLPRETNTMLIRRGYLAYLVSQWSYFFHPYYVALIGNILLWLAACVCAYRFAAAHWNTRVATCYAALTACGTGFIAFVTQPNNYLAGYAVIILLMYAFDVLVAQRAGRRWPHYLLFGGLLGLAGMVYDMFPLFVYLLGYAWLRRASPLMTACSLLVALGIYGAFLFLQFNVLCLTADSGNTSVITRSWEQVRTLLAQCDIGRLYVATALFFRTYCGNLGQAFFVVPVLLAAVGAVLCRERAQGLWIGLALIPSLMGQAFLSYGGHYQATNPRLVFGAYPAVYLLAAMALGAMGGGTRPGWGQQLRVIAPAGVLAGIFCLNNMDAFGYPQLYYLFFMPAYVPLTELVKCWGW